MLATPSFLSQRSAFLKRIAALSSLLALVISLLSCGGAVSAIGVIGGGVATKLLLQDMTIEPRT